MRAVGLYDPAFEHDACGVAFVARLDGAPSHETLARALKALANLEHRGAAGADASTGDGAGILVQMPDAFFRAVLDAELPPPGATGSRSASCRTSRSAAPSSSGCSRRRSTAEGQSVVGWRDVPVDARHVGATAGGVAPLHPAARSSPPSPELGRRRVRAEALRDPPPRRARRRARARRAELLRRGRSSTRGC